MKKFSTIAEIVIARVIPGGIQLVSIIILARLLSTEDYGTFSTGLATAFFFATIATGPIQFSIVPRHAAFTAQGTEGSFEQHTLCLLLLSVGFVGVVVAMMAGAGQVEVAWVALIIASSLYTGWLPILRARLQFWRYGAAALTNAILVLIFVQLLVSRSPSISAAIWAFALSNAAGFLTAWVLCGTPFPSIPKKVILRNMLGVGTAFTVSKTAEDGLFLGSRYAILWFGSPEFLGLFSFAVDIALRSVGVVISIISFALVPKAYKVAAVGERKLFRLLLLRSGFVALCLSLLVFISIVGLELLGWLDLLLGGSFSILAFFAVSIAVIVNNLKKLILDPVAVFATNHFAIPIAYAVIAPLAVGMSIVLANAGKERAILIVYPAAYVLVAVLLTVLIVFWKRPVNEG